MLFNMYFSPDWYGVKLRIALDYGYVIILWSLVWHHEFMNKTKCMI